MYKGTLIAIFTIFSLLMHAQLTKQEFTEVMTEALDLNSLQEYFHIDEDNSRLPITLISSGLFNEQMVYPIEKFGERISFQTISQIRNKNIKSFIEVNKLNLKSNTLELQLEYAIEGVSVNYRFEKAAVHWILKDSWV